MKTAKLILLTSLLVLGAILQTNAQGSGEWNMLLNNDHKPFQVKLASNEMTFYFNPLNDTLSFSMANKKAVKAGFVVEITLKNSSKVVFTSGEKNLNGDKTVIIIPMAEVSGNLKNMKLPSKPKYQINIKDKSVVKQKLFFEFTEK
jgi:hypothetical protein